MFASLWVARSWQHPPSGNRAAMLWQQSINLEGPMMIASNDEVRVPLEIAS